MKYFRTVCITPQQCHSHFCCWLLPIWPLLDFLAEIGAYGLCRLGWRYNRAKLPFPWSYMIVSMIWNTSEISASHLSRATTIFVVDCCQFGPSWMFIPSMIWNTSELSSSHRILLWSVLTHIKKGLLTYNLQYTKFTPCTKNIWMISEYHDDNYEWIFTHQIFLELVPHWIFTLWILLCWNLVTRWAINMHTDIYKYNNI